MSRVLIFGGAGMLGHKAYQVLGGRHEVFATVQAFDGRLRATGIFDERRVVGGVDAWDLASVRKALRTVRPAWVLNCVGIIKQREAANDPTQAIYVNALFPHLLADACRDAGARLIHFSTDCVFSGRRGPYAESDVPDAEDLYGRTKCLGEIAGAECLTIRTSIIGRDLFADLSLVDWFLSQSGGEVRGYAKTLYTGLTTLALSSEVERIIDRFPTLNGLYHVSSEPVSKYDLLVLLNAAFRSGTTIQEDGTEISDRRLVSERYWRQTGSRPPSWPAMIAALAADATDYSAFRQQGA